MMNENEVIQVFQECQKLPQKVRDSLLVRFDYLPLVKFTILLNADVTARNNAIIKMAVAQKNADFINFLVANGKIDAGKFLVDF